MLKRKQILVNKSVKHSIGCVRSVHSLRHPTRAGANVFEILEVHLQQQKMVG